MKYVSDNKQSQQTNKQTVTKTNKQSQKQTISHTNKQGKTTETNSKNKQIKSKSFANKQGKGGDGVKCDLSKLLFVVLWESSYMGV